MGEQELELARFLEVLDSQGCLEHVILIGSWAEFLYKRCGLLSGFEPNIKTMDIDFLVRNMRRPMPEARVASAARERGYLVESDRLTGVTKIYSPKGLEVEFLIGKVGAGLEASLATNLGVTAQSLRHMEILARSAVAVEFAGMRVSVPSPEGYAVHKMVVNHERGKKAEKDALAIEGLWPHLDADKLQVAVASLTRKERVRASDFMASRGLSIPEAV